METKALCSMNNCPSPAVHGESGATPHWLVTVLYCAEHYHEIEKGTPLGPMGVDPSRVVVEPLGTKDLVAPKLQAGLG
jgi:hypothetical protein